MRGRLRECRWRTLCAAGAVVMCASGCAVEGPLSVRRVWFDYNTLKTPALYYDKIHHMPPGAPRVKQVRWMYGKSPGRDDLSLAEWCLEEEQPPEAPPGGNSPTPGYVPLPPLPSPADESPQPISKSDNPEPPPSPAKPKHRSTAEKRAATNRPAHRTALRDGAWRFSANR